MKYKLLFILIISCGLILSCIKLKELATLTTKDVSSITLTTAVSGGNITAEGGGTVSARGACWSTAASPTLINFKTADGTGAGSFSSNLTGLQPGTKYYVRSYATNGAGTAYGNELSFTTNAIVVPTLTTANVSLVSSTTAVSGGNISADGGGNISERGVCWSTTVNPVITDNKTLDGTGTGVFASNISALQPGTVYHARAYATNSAGTGYGNDCNFTTLNLPFVNTGITTPSSPSTVTSGGNVTSDGGSPVIMRGVCWSTGPDPTIALSTKTSNGTGTGLFTSGITGLTAGTTYHVRAYATNSVGTAYGNDIPVTTFTYPSVTTGMPALTSATTVTSGGNVTSDGGSAVTARGVCWSTGSNPTVALITKTSDGTGTGVFTSSITGLLSGTTYHIRAYATNSVGTSYGDDIPVTTYSTATVTTGTTISISATSVTSGGNVISDGGTPVTVRGVCWSKEVNPTVALSTKTSDGTGTGVFTSTINGLTAGTTYHVRAYATNSVSTGYGNDIIVTTYSNPTVTTGTTTVSSATTATSGGNVISDGGSPVFERGVCWSTVSNPTVALNTKTTDGSGTGTFISSIEGLTAGTTYHVRAYATNAVNTSYGNDITITTYNGPSVTTGTVSVTSGTTAISGGNVTSDGGTPVTVRGVCWGIGLNPTVALSTKTFDGTGTGVFTSNITGLSAGTTYHVRAYATNSVGTTYGNDLPFTPNVTSTPPTVTTTTVTGTTTTSAISGGNVTSAGSGTVTGRGVCWGRYADPQLEYDSHTTDGIGTGVFTSSITGLTAGLEYHVRAFATNSAGTSYGSDLTFTTPTSANLPSVTTSVISGLTQTTAISGGNVTSSGSGTVTRRGVCWGRYADPQLEYDLYTSDGTGTGVFISTISGLQPDITYHVRAYATNSTGTSYGSDQTFKTTPLLTDIEGNSYKTVKIGSQIWMAENLKTTFYSDGTPLVNGTGKGGSVDNDNTTKYWFTYDDNISNKSAYGLLYTWAAAMNGNPGSVTNPSMVQGVCPTGWHLPSNSEWDQMFVFLGGSTTAGTLMKESGIAHWAEPNDGTNISGFTAIGGGGRIYQGLFSNITYDGLFWSTVPSGESVSWSVILRSMRPEAALVDYYGKDYGFSVRCVRD